MIGFTQKDLQRADDEYSEAAAQAAGEHFEAALKGSRYKLDDFSSCFFDKRNGFVGRLKTGKIISL